MGAFSKFFPDGEPFELDAIVVFTFHDFGDNIQTAIGQLGKANLDGNHQPAGRNSRERVLERKLAEVKIALKSFKLDGDHGRIQAEVLKAEVGVVFEGKAGNAIANLDLGVNAAFQRTNRPAVVRDAAGDLAIGVDGIVNGKIVYARVGQLDGADFRERLVVGKRPVYFALGFDVVAFFSGMFRVELDLGVENPVWGARQGIYYQLFELANVVGRGRRLNTQIVDNQVFASDQQRLDGAVDAEPPGLAVA